MIPRTWFIVAVMLPATAALGLLGVSVLRGPPELPPMVLLEAVYTPPGRGFGATPEAFWVRANFHAHARRGYKGVGDDGRTPPPTMHEIFERLGYDFSLHTPHSNRNTRKSSPDNWLALKEYTEVELDRVLSNARSVGVELSVAHGPNLKWFKHRRYGRGVGRTLNHTLVFGIDEYTPHLLPLKAAAEWAHVFGGLLFVAHPVIWEKDYFTLPQHIDKLDGIEVYNGIVIVKTGETEEETFRKAVSYAGSGARVAAIGGTDSHGLAWVKDVVTWVRTRTNDVEGVSEAIRNRRTFVTRGFFDLDLDYPQLGRVTRSAEVALDVTLNRKIERIELWRELDMAASWSNEDRVRWRERIASNAAYTFKFVDGDQFGYTSAVWFEPQQRKLPDLVVPPERIEVRGRTVRAVVRNEGEADAYQVRVAIYKKLPLQGNVKPFKMVTIDRLGPGEEARVEAQFGRLPSEIYVKADPESYGRADDDTIEESDERNNAAVRVLKGPRRKRLDRAMAIRARRAQQRVAHGLARHTVRRADASDTSLLPDHQPGAAPELEAHEE